LDISGLRQTGRRPIRLILLATALLAVTSGTASARVPSPSAAFGTASKVLVGATSSGDAASAFKDYVACMKAHGIDMPDPVLSTVTTPGDNADPNVKTDAGTVTITVSAVAAVPTGTGDPANEIDKEKMLAADEACRHFLPEVTALPDTGVKVQLPAAFADYAACMTKRGIDMPAPEAVIEGQAPTLVEVGSGSAPDPGLPAGELKPVEGVIAIGGGTDLATGIDAQAFKAADEACRHLLPDGAAFNAETVSVDPLIGTAPKP
jgi:hypothetical protein